MLDKSTQNRIASWVASHGWWKFEGGVIS
jgi:hypothetical protein